MNEAAKRMQSHLLQVKKIGDSVGLILPKALLASLKLKEGDNLYVVEQTEDGIRLSLHDPIKYAEAMEFARRSFREYAETYKALAK